MIKQLSVFIENKIGSLAGVTSVLRENHINLKAFASYDTPEFTILRLVVDRPKEAKEALGENHYLVNVSDALAVELDDQPGELDRMLFVIAKENIGVNYIYSIVLRNGGAPLIVVHTDELERTEKLLEKQGFLVASQEDLLS